MIKELPRILLVSELTLSFSQEGRSANPTLFNLFESYPPENLMQLVPRNNLISTPPAYPFDKQVISFPSHYLSELRNRLGLYIINPLVNKLNFHLLDSLPIPNKKILDSFSPQILLVCPITDWCLVMGYKLTQYFNCPFLIYFMDDWIAAKQAKMLSGSIQKISYQLLNKSAGWLMISEELQAQLSRRFQLEPKSSLIVHNPVSLSDKQPPDTATHPEGTFKVVYAGSIQSMHYDALAAVAEAIFQLRRDGKDIELVLHTSPGFWNLYKKNFELWEVNYGALIPYNELDQYLKRADLLLVATSFLPELAHITRASVLTKLTDYMAAGRPILCCGPDYSASNRFIKKWECGLVCETNQITKIQDFLREQMNNRISNQRLAIKAFEVLKNNFDKLKVSQKFYDFISRIYIENLQI